MGRRKKTPEPPAQALVAPAVPPDAPDPPDPAPAEVGIPKRYRLTKQPYTMSDAALEQRRKALKSPKRIPALAEGLKGHRNNWRHGLYAKSFAQRVKPCKSTCPNYPCELVSDGATKPGKDCLQKAEILAWYRAVHDAIVNKQYEGFHDLAALQIANTMKLIEMLTEDIMRDGTVIKRERLTPQGEKTIDFVPHPSFLALPKLLADLGVNPAEMMMTPRAIVRADAEEDSVKTVQDLMAKAMESVKRMPAQKPAPPDGDDE